MSSDLEPPQKKTKIIDINHLYTETLDKCIEQIITSEKNLQPIVSDDFYQPLQLMKVFVGHIKNVKDISQTILTLNNKIPLKDLSHLKRVRRQDIILCPTTFLQNVSSIQEYIETHVTELRDVFDYFKEVNVPLLAPKVSKQYTEARKIWSCHFHPNEYFEKLVSDNFFSAYEVKIHRKFMGVVFETVKWYSIHKGIEFDVDDIFRNVNVTVIVDHTCNRIVTIAYDHRQDHPMQHSAMVAIDNVAKTQNGGAWPTECDDSPLPGIDKELSCYLKEKFPHIIIGLKRAKKKSCSFVKSSSVTKDTVQEEKGGPNVHGEKSGHVNDEDKDGAYLCTGYSVYMLREPCVMCAMALVHARAKRVFFCFNNSACGALTSTTKLQTVASLNHHFEVFTGFL